MEEQAEHKPNSSSFSAHTMNFEIQTKLKELLRNLTSTETKLCSDACREFIKLLNSDSGPDFVRVYLQSSHKLVEISDAWEVRKGKLGFSHVLDLISAILKHCKDDVNLDKFARGLVEEKMGELYKELNSREGKKQNAVLLLLGSIVRRNSHLAWEVAKVFDFKLPVFRKLGEVRLRDRDRDGADTVRRRNYSTRKAFVGFAMAFVEIGHPRLLRGVLQQKEMYSGVLRGLGNDDEETVVYVLSVLRDRVLVPESLVPPGLRSVLFGSVTLEQLVLVSGREDFAEASELAYDVLVLACIDPENGLMPDLERQPSPLRGNLKRLLDLMKKLKATEVEYHKDLLRAIVRGRPLFGSAYLDEFPYNLENTSSTNWFAAISLAADVVLSVREGLSSGILDKSTGFDAAHVQHILKCIAPRPFTKLIMNKGLLHSETLVKHGTLRLVLEAVKLLDVLLCAVDRFSQSKGQIKHDWEVLKAEIQDGVRISLPDPQVLLTLLSPLNNHPKSSKPATKRKAETKDASPTGRSSSKRRKSNVNNKYIDIEVTGVSSFPEVDMPIDGTTELGSELQEENVGDILKDIGDIWGSRQCSKLHSDIKDTETYFFSKLFDTLAIYYRTMPLASEGLFGLFKYISSDSLSMSTTLLQSLLNLLVEHVNHTCGGMSVIRAQPQIFMHLKEFIPLLLYSPVREIKEQAYILAKEAMLSTGAFDNNPKDISSWFLFIPGYNGFDIYDGDLEVEIFQQLSAAVVSFLCDAVTTTGNNLYKYMELLMNYIYDEEVGKGLSHEVSPLIICVLEKCLRLLSSESGSFTLPQKSLISLYVCNTIKYLLETQVNAGPLSFLIDRLLSEKLENYNDSVDRCPCEWRPLNSLLCFARKLLLREPYGVCSDAAGLARASSSDSLVNIISDIKKVLRDEYNVGRVGLTVGFSYSLVCAGHTEIVSNLPSILCISNNLQKVPFSVLASVLFLESSHLSRITTLWPENLLSGVEKIGDIENKVEDMFDGFDFNSKEAVSTAFANYLKMAPFCMILSFIVLNTNLHFLQQSAMQKLLLDKLTGLPPDHLITSLRNILFWMYHVRSSHGLRSLDELEAISKLCVGLTEHLLTQLFVQDFDTSSAGHLGNRLPHYADEVADIILTHPAVTALVKSPLFPHKEFRDSVFKENLEILVESVKQGVHALDHHILSMLKKVSELLLPMCKDTSSEKASNGYKRILSAIKVLVQKLVLIFRGNFDECIKSGDFKLLVPTFHALHTLIRFISPFELLELVHWLFSWIDYHDVAFDLQSKGNALFVCLHLASISFDVLSGNVWQPPTDSYSFLDGTEETSCDASLFERVYYHVLEITNHLRLDMSDVSLLKAVKVVRLRKNSENPHLASVMVLSKVIAGAPVNIISHCLNRVNTTKAEVLHCIVEISPLHLSAFGHMFSEILNKSSLVNANLVQDASVYSYSEEELIMLLPTVYLYLNSTISNLAGQLCGPSKTINLVYSQMLLSGFRNWSTFVSGNISEVELDEMMPTTTEEFLHLLSGTLLGKATLMVRNYLALNECLMNPETRLSLFSSLCPDDIVRDDIYGYGISEARVYSHRRASEFVNIIVAKIIFCRMLLLLDPYQFQHGSHGDEMFTAQEVNTEAEKLRIRFLSVLINSWRVTVELFPETFDDSDKIDDKSLLIFRSLEVFLLRNILDLTTRMHDCLIKLSSLPFIERLVKSFLRYRFGDHATLKMLQTVLTSLSDGNIPCALFIQLVLGHSQFVQSIEMARQSVESAQFGLMFTPLSSILRSLVIPQANLNTQYRKINTSTFQQHLNLLELVKLVRVLFHIYFQQKHANFGEDIGIKSRELIYLLLSSYGATCSDIDIEMYGLIQEIATNDRSSAGVLGQTDYLWGIASLRARKDCELGNDIDSIDSHKIEAVEERQRIQFRKNFPVDPKLCAQTVLFFPHFKFVSGGSLAMHHKDNSTVMQEACCTTVDTLQIYDPFFILRFSIHCLSMSYIEPIEFASLGLLAVTFVSVSSPDDDLRKLGYEVLAKFKSTLEICRKKKDVKQLLLLLSYLQNGVQEPWQRIPSFITVFLAEVSLVLLNPSHENYLTISMHLMNSPGVNLKTIPLFQKLFWSTSVNYKADRLWMLRLLYVGLSSEDDAQIYIKSSVFDMLISFYSSPLSDNDSKELIIQILKKAVQFHKTIGFLVDRCGLILWLSSIISSLYGSESQDTTKFTFRVLPILLEVVKSITSTRTTVEWLEKCVIEQLAELSSHLYKLIVGRVEVVMEQTSLSTPILQILIWVLKLSQKRKMHQPHFTMSFEGLYNLYEAVEVCSKTSCHAIMVLGLETILMSSPVAILQTDQEKLTNFLRWAMKTAICSKSTKVLLQSEDSYNCVLAISGENSTKESLVSKLLRWLTASVILGKISCKSSRHKSGSSTKNLILHSWESLLECREDKRNGGEDILASSIFYLLQLLGIRHNLLPSVVPALCLLLLGGSSPESLDGLKSSFSSFCSIIRSPPEANPAWRWSFDEPWSDLSLEVNDVDKLEETRACEKLLVVASNTLLKNSPPGSQLASLDVKDLSVYDWERTLFQSE